MNLNEIANLLELIENYNVKEFNYEDEDKKIELKKEVSNNSGNSLLPKDLEEQKEIQTLNSQNISNNPVKKTKKITSPMIGTFYSSDDKKNPHVSIGSNVKPYTKVCIIEAMKLFRDVESGIIGKIIEILVEDGELVEYDQPLFIVEIAE